MYTCVCALCTWVDAKTVHELYCVCIIDVISKSLGMWVIMWIYICVSVCVSVHYSYVSFMVDFCDLMRRCRSVSTSLFILYNSATTSNYHLPLSPLCLLKRLSPHSFYILRLRTFLPSPPLSSPLLSSPLLLRM